MSGESGSGAGTSLSDLAVAGPGRPLMPLTAWTHSGYATTSVGPPLLCQYQRGINLLMPLPRSSHPGNRTTKNPNLNCKGPAAGTRTQILCLGGSHPHNQTAALSIRPRRALFCMTASGLSLVPASASRVCPGKPRPARLCH